jgi:hypothetical protein
MASSICTKCGVILNTQHILIATGYRQKAFTRKESIDKMYAYCSTCGIEALSKIISEISCPIWIGIPTLTDGKKVAINFIPDVIKR